MQTSSLGSAGRGATSDRERLVCRFTELHHNQNKTPAITEEMNQIAWDLDMKAKDIIVAGETLFNRANDIGGH